MGKKMRWQELLRVEDKAEMRVVSLGEAEDGSLEVEERTDGEVTYLSFGTLTCVRKVCLAPNAMSPEKVAAFFSSKEPFLSDFQDMLDAKKISYTYAVTTGNDIALRMPSQ